MKTSTDTTRAGRKMAGTVVGTERPIALKQTSENRVLLNLNKKGPSQ
jgi:hypothetical protein